MTIKELIETADQMAKELENAESFVHSFVGYRRDNSTPNEVAVMQQARMEYEKARKAFLQRDKL